MSAESPTSSEGKKPKTFFIWCSVVVAGFFIAAGLLNVIFSWSFLFDDTLLHNFSTYESDLSLWGGAKDPLAIKGKTHHLLIYIPLFLRTAFLLLAWWVFLVFCYMFGKYNELAERCAEIKWIGFCFRGGSEFKWVPLSVTLLAHFFIIILWFLVFAGLLVWSLLF